MYERDINKQTKNWKKCKQQFYYLRKVFIEIHRCFNNIKERRQKKNRKQTQKKYLRVFKHLLHVVYQKLKSYSTE